MTLVSNAIECDSWDERPKGLPRCGRVFYKCKGLLRCLRIVGPISKAGRLPSAIFSLLTWNGNIFLQMLLCVIYCYLLLFCVIYFLSHFQPQANAECNPSGTIQFNHRRARIKSECRNPNARCHVFAGQEFVRMDAHRCSSIVKVWLNGPCSGLVLRPSRTYEPTRCQHRSAEVWPPCDLIYFKDHNDGIIYHIVIICASDFITFFSGL